MRLCATWLRTALAALLLAQIAGMTALARVAQAQDDAVVAVRVGDHGDKTRFVLEVTRPLEFRLTALSDPYRLVVDFAPAAWQPQGDGEGGGLILRHLHGQLPEGNLRVVLDLSEPARVRDVFYLPATAAVPYRFVLDLEPADLGAFAELVGRAGAAAMRTPEPERATAAVPLAAPVPLPPRRPQRRTPLIAIDPGHGGVDPGAIGVGGLQEKDVTIQTAWHLRRLLEGTGRYRVFLTREGDQALRLRDRVHLARDAEADMFISVHADSLRNPAIRGASIYTLSDRASDREAAMLARRENRADALVGVDLDPNDDVMAGILIDLAQRQTHNESTRFAGLLVRRLSEDTRVINNPHRRAGFAVLTAPDVPSVLIELGYLSNTEDEAMLADSRYQQTLAAAILRAIDDYYDLQVAQQQ